MHMTQNKVESFIFLTVTAIKYDLKHMVDSKTQRAESHFYFKAEIM